MKQYSIALTEGDGIGPEIAAEAVKALEAVGTLFGIGFEFVDAPAGGDAYKKSGHALPDDTLAAYRSCDAIFKAPVGLPGLPMGLVEREVVLGARQELDLYVNLRPAKIFPGMEGLSPLKPEVLGKGMDIVIVRENSEGLYSKKGETGTLGARDESVYSKNGVERIISYAFEYAKASGRKKITSVDKANVLFTSQFWRKTFEEKAHSHPEVISESVLVDAMSQYLVRSPHRFDVVVTDNLFGDILSDEAAEIAGSLGMCGGANLNPQRKRGMFEPVHGTAPDIAGLSMANPISAILSAKMMLDFLGEREAAAAVETAVEETLRAGVRTKDISRGEETQVSTQVMSDEITKRISNQEKAR
jgi:3-isopropylmalate dehydrogenase